MRSRARASLVAAVLTALSLWTGPLRADDTTTAAPPPSRSQVQVQIGGGNLLPPEPPHEVRITSDSEGTRVLTIDTSMGGQTEDVVDGPRQQLCVAPCAARMSSSGTYMVRGWAINDSAHFGIQPETTELKVHTGSSAVGGLGTTAIVLGTISLIGSAILLPLGYAEDSGSSARGTIVTIGWGTLAGGAALIGLGIALGLASTTHVYDQGGARMARPHLTPSGFVF